MSSFTNFGEQFGYLFYVVSPNKTSFETPKEVPDYIVQVIPHFIILVVLENLLLWYKKRRIIRLNDAVGSSSQGLVQEMSKLVFMNVQLISYTYLYNNWRLATLPWDSLWTWFLCFLGVDFCYYWLHRASHEINILWAAHQVHHSSEDYNLTTALRQSVFQYYFTFFVNLPLALAIPPSVFLVHNQLNLLFQFWIHTEVITHLGPLEYIFNTASHHRVHHGRNRYCIDKNYAGVLIIWDRLFGTFQAEKEEVVYGLTHPIDSFETIYIQLSHFIHIWRTFWGTKGFKNKLSVVYKGPGWYPGTPWHGYLSDIPDVKTPVEKFDPPLPFWCKLYVVIHFFVAVAKYVEIANYRQSLSKLILWGFVAYETFSFSTFGMLLEGRLYAPCIELLRCSLYFLMDYLFLTNTEVFNKATSYQLGLIYFLRFVFSSSLLFWLQYCLRSITVKMYAKNIKKDE